MESTKKNLKNQRFFEVFSKTLENNPSGLFLPTTPEAAAFLTALQYLLRRETSARVAQNEALYSPNNLTIEDKGDFFTAEVKTDGHSVKIIFTKEALNPLVTLAVKGQSAAAAVLKLTAFILARASILNKSRAGVVEIPLQSVPKGILDVGRGNRKIIKAVGDLLLSTNFEVKRYRADRVLKGFLLNALDYEERKITFYSGRKITLLVGKGNRLFAHFVKFLIPLPLKVFQASGVEFNLILKVLNRVRQAAPKIAIKSLFEAGGYTQSAERKSRWRALKSFKADLTRALDFLEWSVKFALDFVEIMAAPRLTDAPKKPPRYKPAAAPAFVDAEPRWAFVNAYDFLTSNGSDYFDLNPRPRPPDAPDDVPDLTPLWVKAPNAPLKKAFKKALNVLAKWGDWA